MPPQTNYRSSTSWSPQDDKLLMSLRARNQNWQQISSSRFPGKTPNACRKRHERLIEKRKQQDWDPQRLENLALAYMEVEKEMWSILGDRTGMKWQLVEDKCMEQGVKNLKNLARTAQRRLQGTEEDSGISMDEAEQMLDQSHSSGYSGYVDHHAYHMQHHAQRPSYGSSNGQGSMSIGAMLSPAPPLHEAFGGRMGNIHIGGHDLRPH